MPLVQLETFKDNSGSETKTILVSSETIFSIEPADPQKPLGENVVPHDKIEYSDRGTPQVPRDWGGHKNPSLDRALGHFGDRDEGYKEAWDKYVEERKKYTLESFFDYAVRTGNPNTRSVLIVRHPQGGGHIDTYYRMPQTIAEIAAQQQNLIALNEDSKQNPAPAVEEPTRHDRSTPSQAPRGPEVR